MNRVGIMIDISHVSDAAFYQVMELSRAPVIASHSSCRHFTPGWERNMDDEMIKLLAKNGGVIQINFGSSFINNDYRLVFEGMMEAADEFAEERGLQQSSPELDQFRRDYLKEHPAEYADVGEVADHIDHVIRLVGTDYVGIGSDFDGVGDSLPVGLKDVSDYPNLIFELLKRGYSEDQIRKICSGNIFRVWSQVEKVAGDLRKEE
jgi:membrane dipeptidase